MKIDESKMDYIIIGCVTNIHIYILGGFTILLWVVYYLTKFGRL